MENQTPQKVFENASMISTGRDSVLVITKDDRSNLENVLIRTMKKITSEHPNVSWGKDFTNGYLNMRFLYL